MNLSIYRQPNPISRRDAEEAFRSNDIGRISDALVAVALHDSDWRWVQSKCLEFAGSPIPEIRGLVATCLGHLARLHGQLDLDLVLPILESMRSDSDVSGRAQDALQDITMYIEGRE